MTATLLLLTIAFRTVGMILAWVFVARYARYSWRASEEGRHLMGFSTVVALFLTYATANNVASWIDPDTTPANIDGDWPGRVLVGIVLYAGTAWFMWQRNRLLTNAAGK